MSQEIAAPAATETTPTASEAPAAGGQGDTLLTGGDVPGQETPEAPAKDAEKAQPTDPAGIVPEAPDGYALTFQEGITVDKGLLGTFQQTAHKLGLNQGQAQELAALYAAHAGEQAKAQTQALTDTQRAWETEIKSSPTFAADCHSARATLIGFGSFGHVDAQGKPALHPELKEIFDETLVGSHPKVFQMFAAIGKALAEPTVHGSGTGSGGRTAEKILYPNMA